MKYAFVTAAAIASGLLSPNAASAQSNDQILKRLEILEQNNAKLAGENAALRERVKRIESPRQVAGTPRTEQPALNPGLSANAAALPTKAFVPPRSPCAQFGGWYAGGQVGWAHYDHTWNDRDNWTGEQDDTFTRPNVHATESGFIGGVQGGYNLQSNCTVFGIEADYNWASINASTFETDGSGGTDLDSLSVSSRLRGLGTIRARTGIVVDNLLLYVTGGLAFADFRRSYTLTDADDPVSETFAYNSNRWGWTAGIGTEWAWTNNWSIKSEVLYARFGKDERTFSCTNPDFCTEGPESKRFDHHDSLWTTRIGINYRFGDFGKGPVGKGPVVTRY